MNGQCFKSEDDQDNLASLGSVGGQPGQARQEVVSLSLGNLGTLPLSQPLTVDQRGEDGQEQAVAHVEQAHHLQHGEHVRGHGPGDCDYL